MNPYSFAYDPRGQREGFDNVGLEAICTEANQQAEEKLLRDSLLGAVDLVSEVYYDDDKRIVRVRGYRPKNKTH